MYVLCVVLVLMHVLHALCGKNIQQQTSQSAACCMRLLHSWQGIHGHMCYTAPW